MKEFNIGKSVLAQEKLQTSKDYPRFAPPNGICWSCKKNIYVEIHNGLIKSGIDVERAGTELVTGCPHCQ